MYIEIDYEGEKLLIETADYAEKSTIEGYETEVGAKWSDFKTWFKSKKQIVSDYSADKLTKLIEKFTTHLHNACLKFTNIPKPNEIAVEFSIGFSITGDVFVAKSTLNSGVKVSMKWTNP